MLVYALLVVGVLLSLANTNAQTELVHRRGESCDGSLPLPVGAYLLAFGGLLAGAIALVLLIRWFRREPLAVVLLVTASAAVIFEILVLVTAFQEGRPVYPMCEG
ncbi:hypothetical protein E0H73_20800 [Kribbella pittospori]|uniref:Uncharacterized protein n=1 Tax=Kribbella pittospori TaxID=722689 RepID=A0A4R0KNA7_9ACTN|nr:hypothetical protein [Kribbella pittospori]TCC60376.1 hypothetical protein E0H73_20800 [Kribbella pittospori]